MFDIIDKKYFYSGELGALYEKDKTVFKVWAPMAGKAKVCLYKTCKDEKPYRHLPMTKNQNGVFEKTAFGDLDGVYYTYVLTYDGIENETIDIYAKSAGVNGAMGMVLDFNPLNPPGWDRQPQIILDKYTDAVIYEVHIRDFSIDSSGRFCYKGRFLAFTEKGIRSASGDPVGLDHIKDLGITHVQLLPVFDFKTVDEADYHRPQFNWGYDPLNFNVPEGSYSTNPFDGKSRVQELKKLVFALHNVGIGVIMDVVYNHTYDTAGSPFSLTFPEYYYRQRHDGPYSNGSGCGNEVATERLMVRKYIIDSLCFWMTEYRIDGFRFDLMGLYDIETLNEAEKILKEINPNVMLYGEGWSGGDSPLPYKQRAMKLNARATPGFAFFSDDFRDTVKGNNFKNKDSGYVNGQEGIEQFAREVVSGRIPHPQLPNLQKYSWSDSPGQVINYVEVHDNLTLWDKLFYTNTGDSQETRINIDKLAAAMVFLSLGIPLIHAGQEFLRSKPLTGGNIFDHNSYRSPDAVNSLKWNRKSVYKHVSEYYKGLIAFRKEHSALRMTDREEISKKLRFFDDLPKGIVGYALYGDCELNELIVFLNPNDYSVNLHAFGEYAVYIDINRAGTKPLYYVKGDYEVAARSAIVLGISKKLNN